MVGLLRRLAGIVPHYTRTAWWGLVMPRIEQSPLRVVQAVVFGEAGVLLSVRSDVRGWELPGGNLRPGESEESALGREVEEETGLRVEVRDLVGEYKRTGFRPHVARVYRCRVLGGDLRPSEETPVVAWFETDALPTTLFPWYRGPLEDALCGAAEPVRREERQGLGEILAALSIDLRMRVSNDHAGRPQARAPK